MSELQIKLEEIKRQKDEYIIPENLKKDVTVYGITGTYEGSGESGDVKLFDTVEHMQQDLNPQEGDLACVYRKEIQPVTEDSEFDSCTFPNTVVLDSAFSGNINGSFRAVDQSVMFNGMVDISSSRFRFNGWGESSQVRVQYTSNDGITYTRTDGGEELQEFGSVIKYEPMHPWNDVIGKFMEIGGGTFEGLYNCIKTKTIDRLPMLSTSATYYQDSEYTKDVEYLSPENTAKVLNALTIMESLQYVDKTSVATLFFDNNLTEFKVYLSTESSTSYKGNYYCAIRDGYVCATPYGYGKPSYATYVVKCFIYDMINDTYTLTDVVATYNDNFGVDFTKWYIPHTNEAYVIGNIPLSKSSSDIDINLYIVPYNKSSGYIFNCKQNCIYKLAYVLVDSQIDTTSDYVYEKTFYGKNGIQLGNLNSNIINSTSKRDVLLNIADTMQAGYIIEDGINFSEYTGINIPFNLNTSSMTNMRSMFERCFNLTIAPEMDTSNVTDMSCMFVYDDHLTSVPNWDTSNVLYTTDMFWDCYNLTSVPNWDLSNVIIMHSMFNSCTGLQNVPNFNTPNATSMVNMFKECFSLVNAPNLVTNNVTTMYGMFNKCGKLVNVPDYNTINVTNLSYMFSYCSKLVNAPNFVTDNVIAISGMFNGCSNLINVPQYNTSKVNSIGSMFAYCNNLSNASIQNIINMCLNSNITESWYKDLNTNNSSSPFFRTKFTNSYYSNRLSELSAAGWIY